MKGKNAASFYLESLLLVCVFVAVILVVALIFGRSKALSREARLLNSAVTLSQNTLEVFQDSGNAKDMMEILDESNLSGAAEDGDKSVFTVSYDADMKADPEGTLLVRAEVTETETSVVYCTVTVTERGTGKTIYTAETAARNVKRRNGDE